MYRPLAAPDTPHRNSSNTCNTAQNSKTKKDPKMKKDPVADCVDSYTRNFLQIYKNLILVWCYVLAQPMINTHQLSETKFII